MDKQSLMKYVFKPDDKLLFSKAFDRLFLCLYEYETVFTDFMDPMHTELLVNAVRKEMAGATINILTFGGTEGCERTMTGFSPPEEPLNEKDFPISAVKISYNANFSQKLSHGDFLGSLTGLGISRGRLGDIIVTAGQAYVFAENSIADFIQANLLKVGRASVRVEPMANEDVFLFADDSLERLVNVSSLRLDNIVGEAFHISRGKSAELFKKEKVFLNWSQASGPDKQVREKDTISVRGFGRLRVEEIEGRTKKGGYAVKIIIKSNKL